MSAPDDISLPPLAAGRMHELSGPAALAFALLAARDGAVLITGSPQALSSLDPDGVAALADPRQVTLVPCPVKAEALWAAETALRAGGIETVILITGGTPDLTSLRRLQLAARAGGALGLILSDRPSAASAAETRWLCQPLLSKASAGLGDSTRLHLSLYKNKKGTEGSWIVDVRPDDSYETSLATGGPHSLRVTAAPAGEPLRPGRDRGR
mgnify:CR=1 FL=1